MKLFPSILPLLIGLSLGVIAGWLAASYQYSRFATSFAAARMLPDLSDAYRGLQALRSGDTNAAVEMLEDRLDTDIIALSALAGEERDAKLRGADFRALKRVRDYRTAHPRKSESPEIDQAVAAALASIDKDTRK